jgi:hypothetical protein
MLYMKGETMSLFIEELDGVTYSPSEWADMESDRMEFEAEQRNERWFEERGFWAARAQEAYEMARGIFM